MQPAFPPQKPAAAPPAAEARGHHQHQGAVPRLGQRGAPGAPQSLLKAQHCPAAARLGGHGGEKLSKGYLQHFKREKRKKRETEKISHDGVPLNP